MALIDRTRRDHARELKALYMERIISAGRRAFSTLPFVDVDLAAIQRMADVPEGKPELYFGSREQLFAVILDRDASAWVADLADRLGAAAPELAPEEAAALVAASLRDHLDLLRLASLAPMVFEQRIDGATPLLLVEKLRLGLTELGSALEQRVARLRPGDGGHLLWRLLVTAAGLMPVSRAVGHLAFLIDDASAGLSLRLDFASELSAQARFHFARWS